MHKNYSTNNKLVKLVPQHYTSRIESSTLWKPQSHFI